MNLFTLSAKIGIDTTEYEKGIKGAESKGKRLGSNLASYAKSGITTLAKGTAALVGVGTTAIGALAKIGVDYNTQMETYTTNFKVMLGSTEAAAKKVEELKVMAAKTPFEMSDLAKGTQTLLAFGIQSEKSTAILQQLGDISLGDSQKLETLTRAFGKMSSSNKVTLEDLNMMIDAGFNPLNIVAKKTGESMTEVYQRVSDGKVAVSEITDAMKTATSVGGQFYKGMEEASKTTTGLISTLQDNERALVGEVFTPLSNSLLQTVVPGAISAVDQLTTAFQEKGVTGLIEAAGTIISGFINSAVQYAPKMIEMAMTLINSLVSGFLTEENIETLATSAVSIITMLATNIMNMLPTILQAGITLIISLAQGIAESLPTLIPAAINAILTLVNTLIAPENLSNLIMAAVDIILALANGLIAAIPNLVSEIPIIIQSLVQTLIELLPELIPVALELMTTLGTYFITYIPTLLSYIPQVISAIFGAFKKTDWKEIGKNIMQGLKDGLTGMIQSIKDSVSNVASIIKDKFKSLLGIASPSKVFKSFGKFIDQGLSMGIEENENLVERSVKSLSNTAAGFSVPTYSYNASTSYASAKPASQSAEHRKIVLDLDINDDGTGLARYLLKYLKVAEKEVYA